MNKMIFVEKKDLILALESSCDETSAAIVRGDGKVFSNVIYSQIETHQKTAGVVPEVAARQHVNKLQKVVNLAMERAGVSIEDITYTAVTQGPGLLTALVCGTTFMSTFAWIHNKKTIPTNHIMGHILSCTLDRSLEEFKFPIVVLSVSGGHNDLYLINDWQNIVKLGTTLDDAAGEAYDKVARDLGLPYPGGPAISKVSLQGDADRFKLPSPLKDQAFNFSFSGLKTNLKYLIEDLGGLNKLSEKDICDLAASFQNCINKNLTEKTLNAASEFQAKEIHLVGGVSANKDLRSKFEQACLDKIVFRYPTEFGYCTDNAAMIAGAARFVLEKEWIDAGMGINAMLDWL